MVRNVIKNSCVNADRWLCHLSAFTLIELMIVVTIISILATVGMIKYSGMPEKARSAEAYAVLSDIAASENAYYTENNAYAPNFTDLDRYTGAPLSDNFVFSLAATYGKAAKKANRGTKDYCLNFDGTKLTCP